MDSGDADAHTAQGTTAPGAGSDHLRHLARTSPKDCQPGHQIRGMATNSQHPGDPSGWELALSELEPLPEQVGDQPNQEELAHDDPYGPPEGNQGTTVPAELSTAHTSPETATWWGDDPMEDADWAAGDDSLRSALQDHILQYVATPADDDAAAQRQAHAPGNGHPASPAFDIQYSTSAQGQGQDQTLSLLPDTLSLDLPATRAGLLQARLEHPDAWCYLNATLTGLMWLLISDPPEEAQLHEICGIQAKAWIQILANCASDQPVTIFDHEALRPLIQSWDVQPHQQCCAAALLEWSQLPLLNHTWEQRLLQGSTVEVFEKGGEHCLLTFNWIEELDMNHVLLSDCIWSWVHHFGMRAAYVSHSPYKCLHLDRGHLSTKVR